MRSRDRGVRWLTHAVAGVALGAVACGFSLRVVADPVYSLAHLSRRDGLPQSSVRAIAVDARGFLWVGTEKGIARYDGYRFTEPASPLNAGVVVKLDIDSRGRVWTRWYGKPATLYDPALDRWTSLPASGSQSPEYLGEIVEAPAGRVWFTTLDRLYSFDERERRLVEAATMRPEPAPGYRLQYAPRLVTWRDSVWAAGDREVVGVSIRDDRAVTRVPVQDDGIARLWVRDDALWMCNAAGAFVLREPSRRWQLVERAPHPGMTACLYDDAGALWMGFAHQGVARVLDGRTTEFRRRADDAAPDRTTLADDYVINLQRDSRGQVWVITPGTAHRWRGAGEGFERFEFSPDSQGDNPGGHATDSFLEDRNGVLWFGSEDHGLARLSPHARRVEWFAPPSTVNAHVRGVAVDSRGDVWLGTNQDGVYRWNRATSTWSRFVADAATPTSLPTREVRALVVTRAGEIWAGSQRGGIVSRFDPARQAWRRYALGVPGMIFQILELPDDSLLICGESGVTQFDPTTGTSRRFELPGTPVRAAALARDGRVYLGTHQHGVVEWVPGRGFGRRWTSVLSDRNVFAVHEDDDGALWIGTWGGGLNRLRPDTGQVQSISTPDGLPDATVFGILPGRHDDLWISTNNGLARMEHCIGRGWPCRPKITVLDTRSGLPFSEFDSEAYGLAPGGSLMFGGYEGLIRFDPDRLDSNRRPPDLQVSSIVVNGHAVTATGSGPAAVELPHDYGTLQVRFTALDLNDPSRSRYEYRLSGREWLALGATPEITLTDLAPGRHDLELRGTNVDGVWSERPLRLAFHVARPWYSSALAWLAYALLAVAALGLVMRWRERRLRVNAAHLENTVAQRTRELADATQARDEFYASVSHEVRTPLALLSATAEQLRDTDAARDREALAADLVRHSDSLRRYVESLITVSHLQSSPSIAWLREDVTAHLRNLIADLARIAGRRTIALDAPAAPGYVRSYPNALDTVFSNLLLNAIRHTPDGAPIRVTIDSRADGVGVAIHDAGAGIDAALLPRLFDRGARGGEAARGSAGHGIGLSLVKQTVLALGGSIVAANDANGGACFTVTLPHGAAELPLASYSNEAASPGSAIPRSRPAGELERGRTRGSILVIEDHDELRAHLVEIFADQYRVRDAGAARAGLALARRYLPDVVICDAMLPDGDGFEIVAALKADTLTDHISVVMLTALADEASRLRGLVGQADLYVTKPFSRHQLRLQVDTLVNQRRRLRRAAAREAWTANAARQPRPAAGPSNFEQRLLAALSALHADPDCDVDALARHLALSRRQLERKTRYCFKCTPALLLTRFRLDRARALLETGTRVGDAALQCGFANASHFGVLYRKRFGHPPSRAAESVGPVAPAPTSSAPVAPTTE